MTESSARCDQMSGGARLILRGVDTLAEVHLNGELIAELDDMFREYPLPITRHLAPTGRQPAGDLNRHAAATQRLRRAT
jgi:hypothetical protein